MCKKTLERKYGSLKGLYRKEENVCAWAWRVSDHKEEDTSIILVNYWLGSCTQWACQVKIMSQVNEIAIWM
jgi:hypothetical protein